MLSELVSMLLALTFGLSSLVPSAELPHWALVIPEHEYYIDQSSIQRHGDVVTYLGKYDEIPDYARLWLNRYGQKPEEPAYLVDMNQIDCQRKTMRYLKDTAYTQTGNVVASLEFSSDWKQITPGSVAESEWEFVCFQFHRPLMVAE